jgi:penicillin-insensitive murein endopeptidase
MIIRLIYINIFFFLLLKGFCQQNNKNHNNPKSIEKYMEANTDNDLPSKSDGSVSQGSLINGKLFPFSGQNFSYFDTLSYISNRAFLNNRVKTTVLETYGLLNSEIPNRQFCIMECSNKSGGKIFPHKTHQNGLSIDFMVPLMKDGKPYYGLDTIGRKHYFLEFNDNGCYIYDTTITIDFDIIAKHILSLNKVAQKNKLKISKVIFKIELKDDLYSTPNGKILKKSGIYLAQQLVAVINSLHDDHYHVDFEEIK